MRLIDADKLLRTLDEKGIPFNADINEAIDNAPTVEPNRWIPCSERLPEKGKVVLITNDKGNVRCGQYRGLWYSNGGNVNKWVFRGNMIETVVAWMPLPEPARLEE